VITNANNVVGLVYVAAFAPDEGEKVGDLTTRFPEAAGFHRIGRTADDDRAGVHPVSRARHVQAKGGAVPPLTDSRVGAEISEGVASGQHSHPGPEVGYIVRGDVAMEFDDREILGCR
jgi:hypothetical protein